MTEPISIIFVSTAPTNMLFLGILVFMIGNVACTEFPESSEDRVGPLNLTPHEAGIVAFAAVLALGVVGVMCLLLVAAVCGYRFQATELYRKLKDVEVGSRRPPAAEKADSDLDFPPPPPAEDENDNMTKDDTTVVPEPASPPSSVTTKAELNSSQDVDKALGDMDDVVDEATCSTASVKEGDCDSKLADATADDTGDNVPDGTAEEENTEMAAEAASDGAAAVGAADTASGEETAEAGSEAMPNDEDAQTAF